MIEFVSDKIAQFREKVFCILESIFVVTSMVVVMTREAHRKNVGKWDRLAFLR